MRERLKALERCGFRPASIIDAGAYEGAFALLCRELWPQSRILMIDALESQKGKLDTIAAQIGNAEVEITMLGERDAESVPFHIVNAGPAEHVIRTGSSRYSELTDFSQEVVGLRQRTLDTLLKEKKRDFQLIKFDIQGSEIDALEGGRNTVELAEFVLLETSLVQYNRGAPVFHDVIRYLHDVGFVLYDVIDESRRSDKLFQLDCLFVKEASEYRLRFDRFEATMQP